MKYRINTSSCVLWKHAWVAQLFSSVPITDVRLWSILKEYVIKENASLWIGYFTWFMSIKTALVSKQISCNEGCVCWQFYQMKLSNFFCLCKEHFKSTGRIISLFWYFQMICNHERSSIKIEFCFLLLKFWYFFLRNIKIIWSKWWKT